MIGYLQTCISKYLYATTDESRQALIDEFADFDGRQAMSYNINDPLILWHERKVQGALYLSMGLTNEAGNAQEMASEYERDLPSNVRSAISTLRLSSDLNPEVEERVIEQEIIFDKGRERGREQGWDRDNPEPRYVETRETYGGSRPNRGDSGLALATAGLGALARNKPLDRSRSRYRSSGDRRRRDIRRQSSLDTIDRKTLTREVDGTYGWGPRYIESQETYVKAPTGNFERERNVFQERERPTIENDHSK
jgi:hypothetical protein